MIISAVIICSMNTLTLAANADIQNFFSRGFFYWCTVYSVDVLIVLTENYLHLQRPSKGQKHKRLNDQKDNTP